MNPAILKVAIVGSGPAGCYSAQFCRKKWPTAEITIFEQLPVPYGLVRYGIAADHQGAKAVIDQFDRLFQRERVGFMGNVAVGRDIPLSSLSGSVRRSHYCHGLGSRRNPRGCFRVTRVYRWCRSRAEGSKRSP